MNRDDIIKMAREAGFTNPERLEIFGIKDENLRGILEEFWINLERFAALVAAAEKREWVGLTEIEICDIEADELTSANSETFSFARAIEAKLKEKNT